MACLPLVRGELWIPGAALTVEVSVEELDVSWDEGDGTGSSLGEEPCFIAKVIIRESVRRADSEVE